MSNLLKFAAFSLIVGFIFLSSVFGGLVLYKKSVLYIVKSECKNCEWENG